MTYFTGRETMREMRAIVRMIDMQDDTDTSDEAFEYWAANLREDEYAVSYMLQAWREAIRRCEAQIEERERKAFEAGWKSGWNNLRNGWLHTEDEDYRTFKKAQKK